MKNKLLVCIYLLATSSVLAGTPDQDKIVRELRERFRRADIPSVVDLKPGKRWSCTEHVAARDNFHRSEIVPYQFEDFEGFVKNVMSGISFHDYYLTAQGLVARRERNDVVHFDFIRITPERELISELASPKIEAAKYAPAYSDYSLSAQSYAVCR